MCFEVDAQIVLLNYLFHNPDKSIDMKTLNEITDNIYRHSDIPLCVNTDRDSTVGTVEIKWFLFDWDKKNTENIVRAKNSEKYFIKQYVDKVNYGTPVAILSAIEKACNNNYENI
jgi:hypothetical protein